MELYSTQNKTSRTTFRDAIFSSMPSDKGLYMPVKIPKLASGFLENIETYSFNEIALKVATNLLEDEIPKPHLKDIIEDAFNFEVPIVELDAKTAILELFHGPSLAFKDFGARFMSRTMAYFLKPQDKTLDILVATSGDTGGAVALGFLGVPGTRVTILYPKGKVSPIQELQLTSHGENIRALEVEGNFDDCQALVKKAFNDVSLNRDLRLTSANSINIARLVPQSFYYFYAFSEMKAKGKEKVVFSVPSGNFGNIAAGIMAYKMGLPIAHFIAATNANDTVPRFLKTGDFSPKPSVHTYSNAMDVAIPSNWPRVLDLFDDDKSDFKQHFSSYSFSDKETLVGIEKLDKDFGYLACPHTSIGWLGLKEYFKNNNNDELTGISIATAHPCKFPNVYPEKLAKKIKNPVQVDQLTGKNQEKVGLPNDYSALKSFLLSG